MQLVWNLNLVWVLLPITSKIHYFFKYLYLVLIWGLGFHFYYTNLNWTISKIPSNEKTKCFTPTVYTIFMCIKIIAFIH